PSSGSRTVFIARPPPCACVSCSSFRPARASADHSARRASRETRRAGAARGVLCIACHGRRARDALDPRRMTTLDDTRAATAGASRAAIEFHYDVGTAFYRLWLGDELTYSCAMFEDGDDLEAAQGRKIDFHARASGAIGAASVLDVGCGWGSTMRRLVERHGVERVTGLTLSRDQAADVERQRLARVTVRLESWEQHEPAAPYDAIVSIGAFEHFARRDLPRAQKVATYRRFFARCRDWLRPGGALSLQTI